MPRCRLREKRMSTLAAAAAAAGMSERTARHWEVRGRCSRQNFWSGGAQSLGVRRASLRLAKAASRASASETSGKPPSPSSRRRPPTGSQGAAPNNERRLGAPATGPLARDQKSWDAGLGGTKRDGCGTNPGVCWVFSWRRRPTGAQDFWLAFFPHSAIFEGGWTGFDPLENRV